MAAGADRNGSTEAQLSDTGATGWLHRLRERGVIRVAASYAVIAWLLLQIADVTFGPLGVPGWIMVSLIVAAVLGFPVAVALAWFYEAGGSGVTRDTAAEGVPRPVAPGLRRYADVAIIAVLLAAVAVLLVRQSDLGPGGARGLAIAVLPFQTLSTSREADVLASGIAESVLHQLASLAELDVISRTSSFAFRDRAEDAREIGRQLGARYLLEGSVQSDPARMRVTTQLIDTETGSEVWSMRFDRRPGDVFAIQDEIAVQVTQALELSLDPEAKERMTGQGTTNLQAYLAFLQGRALLATGNVTEVKAATGHFERSVTLDPQFPAAYVNLAQAELFVAEFEVTDDRQVRFEAALERGEMLVQRALSLDPEHGDALLERAHLAYYTDLAAAETDYRRGLELSPNSAEGFAGLAAVLYETPSRRDEALEMLDRARRLDPLEPAHDVTKSVFLWHARGDAEAANALLVSVLKRNSRYTPALERLCAMRSGFVGQSADAVRYCEAALELDPLLEDARRVLIRLYVNLGDPAAARQLVGASFGEPSPRALPILLDERQWAPAGEVAYASLARRTASPITMAEHLFAIRMHARTTGDFARAVVALEQLAGVRWDATGQAVLPEDRSPIRDVPIALSDVLLADGQADKGRRLLGVIIERMRQELGKPGQAETWYYLYHPLALLLNGERDAAIGMLERRVAKGFEIPHALKQLENDPSFAGLRKDARVETLIRKMRSSLIEQRGELERLRAEGLVPDRSGKPRSAG
jgi:TolB-like protein/Tfp pilus assembly protein PilF